MPCGFQHLAVKRVLFDHTHTRKQDGPEKVSGLREHSPYMVEANGFEGRKAMIFLFVCLFALVSLPVTHHVLVFELSTKQGTASSTSLTLRVDVVKS